MGSTPNKLDRVPYPTRPCPLLAPPPPFLPQLSEALKARAIDGSGGVRAGGHRHHDYPIGPWTSAASDFWMTSRVRTARSAAISLRSFLGWHPFLAEFFNTIRTKSCHLPIASDIKGWFFIKIQHEMLSIFMSFTWDEGGGNTARFGGQIFPYDQSAVKTDVLFWWGCMRKRKRCPFWGLILFCKSGYKCWLLLELYFFLLKSIRTRRPFFAKLLLEEKQSLWNLLWDREETPSIIGQISHEWKNLSTFRAELLKSRTEWCPSPLIPKRGNALHFSEFSLE